MLIVFTEYVKDGGKRESKIKFFCEYGVHKGVYINKFGIKAAI